jgi:ABC-type polysaccharide/polyol phosphate transport system ATPase subunit
MSDGVAIKVENVTKVYKLYNTPMDRLKESLHPLRRKYHHDFYALHDVSFDINKGETVGIIGKNGSGKSTLLKLITGVLTPTLGTVSVNGKISALLELGSGFNPELTGVENVYFNGTLMGYSKEEMDDRLDVILGFADIGEFVHQPVKTYSSGMFVRLAFAVAVNVEPDILVVDEALAVGDIRFQKKCKERMNDYKDSGSTIILVSHAMADIRSMCNKGIFLQQGSLMYWGDVSETINKYAENESEDEKIELSKLNINRIPSSYVGDIAGTGDVVLRNVRCYQKGKHNALSVIEFGKAIIVEFDYEAFTVIEKPIITVNIGCAFYRVIANISSVNHDAQVDELFGEGKIRVEIPNQQFYPGAYVIHVAVSTEKINVHYFMHNAVATFIITAPKDTLLCYPAALVQPAAIFTIEGN